MKKKKWKYFLIPLVFSIIVANGLNFFPNNNSTKLSLKLSIKDKLTHFDKISDFFLMELTRNDLQTTFEEHLILSRKNNKNYCQVIYINKKPIIDFVINSKKFGNMTTFELDLKLLVKSNLKNINICVEKINEKFESILKDSLIKRKNHNNNIINEIINLKNNNSYAEINSYLSNLIIENSFLEIVSRESNLLVTKNFKAEVKKNISPYLAFLFSFISLMIIFNFKKIIIIYKKII